MQAVPGYINDGYTEQGYLAGVPRLHPPLRFAYRPCTHEQRQTLLSENAALKDGAAVRNTARVLAAKVKQWDLTDEKGAPVPVAADAICRLRPALYDKLVLVVMGLTPSDEDPARPQAEPGISLADQLAAAEQGTSPGAAALERHEGN